MRERNDFLNTAIKAARLAGEVMLYNLGKISKKDIDLKQAADFVTRVDRKSEQIIINTMRQLQKYEDNQFCHSE